MIYLGDFENEMEVYSAFSDTWDGLDSNMKQEMENSTILFAWYGGDGYEGSAFVLFHRDGKLYEVNGGHCSCYGLEGQWDPEETSVEAVEHRVHNGSLGWDSFMETDAFRQPLLNVLKNWKLVEFCQYDNS